MRLLLVEISFLFVINFGAYKADDGEYEDLYSIKDTGLTEESSTKLVHWLKEVSESFPMYSKTMKPFISESKISFDDQFETLQTVILEQGLRISLLEDKIKKHANCKCESKPNNDALYTLEARIKALEYLVHEAHPKRRQSSLSSKSIRKPRNFLEGFGNQVISGSDFSSKVAFDGYRDKPLHQEQVYVTYDGAMVNRGEGLDIKTGIFKAPIEGIYFFSFHALCMNGRATYIKIVHNNRNVGGAYRRHEAELPVNFTEYKMSLERAEGMLSQSLLLPLKKGDQVAVYAYHGNLRDGGWHYTHFIGFRIADL